MAYRSRWAGIARWKEVATMTCGDQHGRHWETGWDKKGMGTYGTKEPGFVNEGMARCRWSAPVMPPSDCLLEFENKPQYIEINYNKWIAGWADAELTYENSLRQWAQAMRLSPDHPEVVRMAGPRPLPVKVVEAAQAGNKWALGLVPFDQYPRWAKEYYEQLKPLTREMVRGRAISAYPDREDEDPEASDEAHAAKVEEAILRRKVGRPAKVAVEPMAEAV